MKDSSLDETVIDTLQDALESDRLPVAARDYAQHLLRRLASPVRVSVLGLPLSGKSELINMFVGERLFPKDADLPTTEVVYGETARMTVTSADGKVDVSDKIDLERISGQSAAFLKIELPAPILRRVSLLEVVTDGTVDELNSAVDWSVRRTDIALWCSQSFASDEQAVWRRVPDSLKDHAFLVLTKADVLSGKKSLSKQVAALESVVAEEFHSLFAVATLQAINAYRGEGNVDEAMYHASGGGALTAEILRHAERGRRADFDGAHLFLARYKIAPSPAKAAKAKPAEQKSEAPPEVADQTTAIEEIAAPGTQPVPVAPKIENAEIFTDAVRFLKRRGESLGNATEKLGEGKANDMISQCVDAVEHLVDLFSRDESGCPAADAFLDELAEASDVMVLMQVETGDGPAADAATLLLQLRREMEMKLAA